jgi:hypothetical protein
MPINKHIGGAQFDQPRIHQFSLENIVPETATQLLIYATVYSGNTYGPTVFVDISIFVYVDDKDLAQHLYITAYQQEAYNSNTDNMWFPVPSSKIIYVYVPVAVPGWAGFRLEAIGYC